MPNIQKHCIFALFIVFILTASAMPQDDFCSDCSCVNNCCCPKWQVRAGAIFLDREDPKPGTLLFDIVHGEAPLDYSDFSFDMDAGWEISLARNLNHCWNIEARYFRVDAWSSNYNGSLDPGLYYVQYQSTRLGTGGGSTDNSSAAVCFASDLQSLELLAKRRLGDRWNLSAGFRCLEANDDIHAFITNVSNGDTSDQRFTADNWLYGFQVGLDGAIMRRGRFRIEGVGKAGVYGNVASGRIQESNRTQYGNFDLDRPGAANQTSFVGEAGLFAVCDLTSRVAFRCGYQVLYLTGLTVGDDLTRVNESSGSVALRTDSTLFYHGASTAVEYRF